MAKFIPNVKFESVEPFIKDHVQLGTRLITDEAYGYNRLKNIYAHDVINHRSKVYVVGDIHTNTIENFWSVVKRCVNGTYHQISEKHIQKYLNEFSFRYNNRASADDERFTVALTKFHGRLKYSQLIQKDANKTV